MARANWTREPAPSFMLIAGLTSVRAAADRLNLEPTS